MYSINVDGKVLDFRYKKQNEFTYAFYIGDILIGQIFKMGRAGWTAVFWGEHNHRDLFPVDGFKTRYAASEFMLKVGGYIKKEKYE